MIFNLRFFSKQTQRETGRQQTRGNIFHGCDRKDKGWRRTGGLGQEDHVAEGCGRVQALLLRL